MTSRRLWRCLWNTETTSPRFLVILLVFGVASCASPRIPRAKRATVPSFRTEGLQLLADTRSDLHLIPSEADRVTHPTARRFVEGRGAYWNRDTVAAATAFEEVLVADWNAVSEHGRRMLVLQVFEEARDWSGAAEAYPRLGLQESHSARLCFTRTTASFPLRTLEFATQAKPIAFDLHRGQLVVLDARMEGRPVRLMVDTGFSSTFVTADFARQAGLLVTSETIRMSDSNDSESLGRLALLGSLEVAGVTVRNLPVVTAPPRLLRKLAGPIDGVLGWDVLRDMVVIWDFPSRQITLLPSVKSVTGVSGDERANLAGYQQPVIRATAALYLGIL